MKRLLSLLITTLLFFISLPISARKVQPIIDKDAIKAERKNLEAQYPKARIKTIVEDDGSVYIGEVKRRVRQGVGTMCFASHDVYTGMWDGGVMNGSGIMSFANGEVYQGGWKNDKREGEGTMTYANGDVYKGRWKENTRDGDGEMRYANGDIYTGAWKGNKREGKGTMKYANGVVYKGEWKENMSDGDGEMSYVNGDIYTGGWKDDKREGEGIMKYANKSVYHGLWKEDMREGEGTMKYANGELYQGGWKNDMREGIGTMTYANRNVYNGEWLSDVKSGKGIMTYYNGAKYDGGWFNNQMHGVGKVTYSESQTRIVEAKETRRSDIYNSPAFAGLTMGKSRTNEPETITELVEKCVIEGVWNHGQVDGTIKWKDSEGIVTLKPDNTDYICQGSLHFTDYETDYTYTGSFRLNYVTITVLLNSKWVASRSHFLEGTLSWNGSSITGKWNNDKMMSGTININDNSLTMKGTVLNEKFKGSIRTPSTQFSGETFVEKLIINMGPRNQYLNKVYHAVIKEYPIEGVNQDVSFAFYDDGKAVRRWQNSKAPRPKTKRSGTSICPHCYGQGYTTSKDNWGNTEYHHCYVCDGKGKVSADNKVADFVSDFQDEVFWETTKYVYSDGTEKYSGDIAKEGGIEYATYEDKGNSITYKNMELKKNNGSLLYDKTILKPTVDPVSYEEMRKSANVPQNAPLSKYKYFYLKYLPFTFR